MYFFTCLLDMIRQILGAWRKFYFADAYEQYEGIIHWVFFLYIEDIDHDP